MLAVELNPIVRVNTLYAQNDISLWDLRRDSLINRLHNDTTIVI
jgi:hypothetical protein